MDLFSSVTAYFYEAVTSAARERRVAVSGETEFYLVTLLAERSGAGLPDEPLVLKLAAAASAPSVEDRARGLRDVGDTSLYVVGFFEESLTHHLVDVEYYERLGETAYGQLAQIVSTRRPIFAELSLRFEECVEILRGVRAGTTIVGSTNLVRVAEEWQRSGAEWAERRLRESGLVIVGERGKKG